MPAQEHQFQQISDEELRDKLANAAANREDADQFFGQFQYVHELLAGNHSSALFHGLNLLGKCQRLAPQAYNRIHKGTPYYWLGTAAFLVHDYQTAAFFYDAGVSEDLRHGADPVANPTPGLRFIQLEGDQPNQAAQSLVQATQAKVDRAISEYNERPGRPRGVGPLQMRELRERFLRRAVSQGGERLRTLATALISFFLEWDHRSLLTGLVVGRGTTEPFFLHLFKGCLLFESLLKANTQRPPPRNLMLGQVLQHLHSELGIAHDVRIGNVDFGTILSSLPSADDSIPSAIEYTGKIRNTLGHDLGWEATLDAATYDGLAERVASSCLHVIACLYREPQS